VRTIVAMGLSSSQVPKEAVVYLRVSSERQKGSGLGAEAQEAACRKYAELRGWDIVGVYRDDAASGMLPAAKRPGLTAALAAVGVIGLRDRVLLVQSLSRFCRCQQEFWRLVKDPKNPVPLVSATESIDLQSAMGRAVAAILGAVAQLESELSSERSKAAWEARKARGVEFKPPMERMELACPEVVVKVRELVARGWSQRAIAEWLNMNGFESAGGKKWHQQTVSKLVARLGPSEAAPVNTNESSDRPAQNPRPSVEQVVRAWRLSANGLTGAADAVGMPAAELMQWVGSDAGLRAALRRT